MKSKIAMKEKDEGKIIREFNKNTRVIEWVSGNTYFINTKKNRLKSSSLDELFEMFKADFYNLPIPKRTSFFHK